MQGFFGVLAFLAIGAGLPIIYMWSLNQFVGQRPAPKWGRTAVLVVASLAIGYSTLLAVVQTGFGDLVSLLLGAVLAGSGITGVVALQERFEDKQDVAK